MVYGKDCLLDLKNSNQAKVLYKMFPSQIPDELVPLSTIFETGVPWENHRPAAGHWQTLSHNVVSSTPCHEWDFDSQR